MLKLTPVYPIFKCFAIFGQSGYDWIFTSKSCLILFIVIILNVMHYTFLAYSFIYAYKTISELEQFIVVHSISFLVLITDLVGILEGWIKRKIVKSILTDINDSLCKLNVPIASIIRKFYKKVIFALIFFIFEWIVRLFHPHRTVHARSTHIVLFVASMFKFITLIHVTLYIDLQCFILESLNKKLNPTSSASAKDCLIRPIPVNKALNSLSKIKPILQKIGKISGKINERFGYFVVVYTIHSCSLVIYAGLGVYLTLSKEEGKLIILRKLNYFIIELRNPLNKAHVHNS